MNTLFDNASCLDLIAADVIEGNSGEEPEDKKEQNF